MLYSYLRYIGRFLDVFFFLLGVILSELHENPRWKDSVTEKCACSLILRRKKILLQKIEGAGG